MINGKSLKIIFRFPLTWAVLSSLGVLTVFSLYWFQPPVIIALASLLLPLFLIYLWILMVIRSPEFAEVTAEMTSQRSLVDNDKLIELQRHFMELNFSRGIEQLLRLKDKFENLKDILIRRFDRGELTHGRYLATAEQVYLSVIDNLFEIEVALRSVSKIDAKYVNKRLKDLTKLAAMEEEHVKEQQSLEERLRLLGKQQGKVKHLSAQNAEALTGMDKIASALADTRINRGHASADAQTTMKQLEELANRVGRYASNS